MEDVRAIKYLKLNSRQRQIADDFEHYLHDPDQYVKGWIANDGEPETYFQAMTQGGGKSRETLREVNNLAWQVKRLSMCRNFRRNILTPDMLRVATRRRACDFRFGRILSAETNLGAEDLVVRARSGSKRQKTYCDVVMLCPVKSLNAFSKLNDAEVADVLKVNSFTGTNRDLEELLMTPIGFGRIVEAACEPEIATEPEPPLPELVRPVSRAGQPAAVLPFIARAASR